MGPNTTTLTVTGDSAVNKGWADEGGNYTRVQTDDGNTTRLYTPSSQSTRSFLHSPFNSTDTINGVTIYMKLANLGAYNSIQRLGFRIGSSNYFDHENKENSGTTYQVISQRFTYNPATGQPWTAQALNDAEFGLKKEDSNGTALTYAYMVVDSTPTGGNQLTQSASDSVTVADSAQTSTGTGTPGPAIVQAKQANTLSDYVNSSTIVLPGDAIAGDVLVLTIATSAGDANTITSVTDTRGNTWTKRVSYAANARSTDIWTAEAIAAGPTTVTVASSTYSQKGYNLIELRNIKQPLVIDATATAADTGYVVSRTLPLATTELNDIIVGSFASSAGTAVYPGENVFTSGGDTTNNGTVIRLDGGNDVTIESNAVYEQGAFAAIAILMKTPVAPADPTPLHPTTYAWHPYGVKPNKTTAQLQTAAREAYDAWFGYTLTSAGMPSGMPAGAKRIKVPDQGFYNNPDFNGTVSEGIGYGMLISAWMSNPDLPTGIHDPNARANFDALWKYYKHFKNSRGLMHWNITYQGVVADPNGATDGDLDAAMGLVTMARLWSSDGAVNYDQEADTLLQAIIDWEFVPATGVPGTGAYPNIITNGDGWGFATDNLMPDYFRAGFLREFYYHSGDTRWLDIVTANYTYALKYYYDNYAGGLVPDRQKRDHTSLGAATDKVTYNSVRLGFGVMLDHLWHGTEAPALGINMMNKMADKAKANFTTGGNVKAPEYDLDFSTWQTYSNLSGHGLIGPAALGKSANQTFATEMFEYMDATTEFASSYFNGGVGLMGMMTMAGLAQPYRTASAGQTLTLDATDSAGAADAIARAYEAARTASDSTTPADAASRTPGKAAADAVTPTDSARRAISPRKTDTQAVVDVATRQTSKAAADIATVTDEATANIILAALIQDDVTASDAALTAFEAIRTASDSVTATDDAFIIQGLNRTTSDTANATDAAQTSQEAYRSASDTATASDAAQANKGAAADIADSVTASDSQAKDIGDQIADTQPIADAAAKTTSKAAADSQTVVDDATRQAVKTASDAAITSESLAFAISRAIADVATVTDEASSNASTAGQLNRSDSVTLSDAIFMALTKRQDDSAGTNDAHIKAATSTKSDQATAADTTPGKDVTRPEADTAAATDDRETFAGFDRTQDESLTTSDDSTRAIGKRQDDTIDPIETIAKALTTLRGDTATATDTPAKTAGKPAADSVNATDNSTRRPVIGQNDAIVLTDATTKDVETSLQDIAEAEDIISKTLAYLAWDELIATDQISLEGQPLPADSIIVTDAARRQIGKYLDDTAVVTDQNINKWIRRISNDIEAIGARAYITRSVTIKARSRR